MAKGSKGRKRDTSDIAMPTMLSPSPLVSPTVNVFDLVPVEDNRTWHPEGPYRHPRTVWGGPSGQAAREPTPRHPRRRFPTQTRAVVAFQDAAHVVICARRRIRKEVLHALKHIVKGKGRGGRSLKLRRTHKSRWHC